MPWETNFSRKLRKPVRALMITDGRQAYQSGRGGWVSLQKACWAAYDWKVWTTPGGGGIAFVHELEADPQNPYQPNRGTVCFAVASQDELRQFMVACGFVPPEPPS
jgi:hypothetical protein